MRNILGILVILTLCGCASVEMTEGGRQVREIPNDIGTNCEFLGVQDTTAPNLIGNNDVHIKNVVRNEVYEIGGNAFMLSVVTIYDFGATKIQYDAYRCD